MIVFQYFDNNLQVMFPKEYEEMSFSTNVWRMALKAGYWFKDRKLTRLIQKTCNTTRWNSTCELRQPNFHLTNLLPLPN